MTKPIVLVDIGSTFTKLTVVNREEGAVVVRCKTPTTPQNISIGVKEGLALVEKEIGAKTLAEAERLACSSAAGGLKMVAIGLVRDLTAEAAKRAALGAGARVVKTYAFLLTDSDLAEIKEIGPDIILLAGGTDGGNKDIILGNAQRLVDLNLGIPVVVAGNRSVAKDVASILKDSYHPYSTENVMPEIGTLNVEPARECIRKVFIEEIIYAKGFTEASRLLGEIAIPTPAAVLRAGQLLSRGTKERDGMGDLLIVDVGGATTDVHSFGHGHPTSSGVMLRGLPEPFAKRTVEGDLGVRVSALSLAETVGFDVLADFLGAEEEEVKTRIQQLVLDPGALGMDWSEQYDGALGHFATKVAVNRHVGHLTQTFTPAGQVWIQDGKDLTAVPHVLCTGGVYVHSKNPRVMATGVQHETTRPLELKPKKAKLLLDTEYVLAAMGLLSYKDPVVAFDMLRKNLLEMS